MRSAYRQALRRIRFAVRQQAVRRIRFAVRRARALSFAAALAIGTLSPQVIAQATLPAAPADAQTLQRSRALFEQGRKLTEQNLWEEACLLFEQAHELHATGGTALQLGNCYEHVSKYRDAVTVYQFVIDHADREANEDRVKIARERIEAIERRIGPAPAPVASAPIQTQPDTLRLPAYVSLGVGGGGFVVGTLFGVLALSQAGDVKSTCTSGICPHAEQSSADAAKAKGWVSTIGFGVGIVGVSIGAALLYVDTKRGHPIFGKTSRIVPTADGVSFRF